MHQPPAARKPGKKIWFGAVAVVVLLGAGCCAGGRLLLGARQNAEPVSAADYATTLTEVDGSLRAPLAAVSKGDKAALATSAAALTAGADKLETVKAPEAVNGAHLALIDAMRDLGDASTDAGTAKLKCPAGSAGADLLRSPAADKVRAQAKSLAAADPSFKVAFLPAAPKEQSRRLANGAFVVRKSGRGSGELKIENGAGDTTVSLVPKGAKKPAFTVYVRGKSDHTVEGVKNGTYEIFSAAGEDWDARRKGFTRDCSFTKFDDEFTFEPGTGWTITLKEVVGGNASTSEVDPGAFPGQ